MVLLEIRNLLVGYKYGPAKSGYTGAKKGLKVIRKNDVVLSG
jgi:hypothetical protein